MNKFFCLFILLGFALLSYSQERTIKISSQYGFFRAGDYKRIQPGESYGIDMSYFLSSRFFLTAHFNHGMNYFYDDVHTKYPDIALYPDDGNTNAKLIVNNIGILAGYYSPATTWANITGQIGISQIIETAKAFPSRVYDPDSHLGYNDRNDLDATCFSMAFPVKFSAGITPFKQLNIGFAKNIEIGYALGFYMSPDFGFFTGVYHGPQLSVSF